MLVVVEYGRDGGVAGRCDMTLGNVVVSLPDGGCGLYEDNWTACKIVMDNNEDTKLYLNMGKPGLQLA